MEEALANLSVDFMNPSSDDKLFSVTDITPEEVFGVATLLTLSDKLGSDLMRTWVINFLRLRISRLRTGRREMLMLGSGIKDTSEKRKHANLDSLFQGLK
jgi:hypothetical protein